MDSFELARLLVMADQLSPERHPDRAIALNRRIVQLDPRNAAAYVRLARGYQAQRNFSAAVAACRDALCHNPQSVAAQRRLQRITEEWELYQHVQAIETYEESLRRRVAYKDQERIDGVIACLWRTVELSPSRRQAISCHNALAAAYRSKKDAASLDLAAVQYEWVLRQAPGNLTARRGLTAVLREQQVRQREGEREQRRQKQWAQRKSHHQRTQSEQHRRSASAPTKQPMTLEEALKLLKLKPPATRSAIKRAYRAQAQVAHPDHGGSHTAMVRLNAAYALALSSV